MITIAGLNIGDKVRFGAHKIKNEPDTHPLTWIVVDKNHQDFPNNTVTLMTQYVIDLRAFDAKEAANIYYIGQYGNAFWGYSNISQWLNSSATGGAWFSLQHNKDVAPSALTTSKGTQYTTNPGFLYHFSEYSRSVLVPTVVKTTKTNAYSFGPASGTYKVFLPALEEFVSAFAANAEGTPFRYFVSNDAAIPATLSPECRAYTSATPLPAENTPVDWMLRTAKSNYEIATLKLSANTVTAKYASDGDVGIRPVVNVSSDTRVYDTPIDGVYNVIDLVKDSMTITDNPGPPVETFAPPVVNYHLGYAPGTSLSVMIKLNGRLIELYTASMSSTSPYYKYTMDNLSFLSTTPWTAPNTPAINTIEFTISAPTGTTVRSTQFIRVAKEPVVTTPESIPAQTGEFDVKYKISGENTVGTLSCVTYVDSPTNEINTIPNASKTEYTVRIPSRILDTLTTGTHTLYIKVTDSNPGGSPLITLKAIPFQYTSATNNSILFMTKTMSVDAMPSSLLMLLIHSVDIGDTVVKVEACNNANDTSPTWEDITPYVNKVYPYNFRNTVCTALTWGVQIKVSILKTTQLQNIFVHAIGFSIK